MTPGRVSTRGAFAALTSRGVRARHGVVRVTFVAGEDSPSVAYAVGRPVGSAVVRNRVRRRLRAAVREVGLPAGTWLVGVSPAAAGSTYAALRDDLAAAADEAMLRVEVRARDERSERGGGGAGLGTPCAAGAPIHRSALAGET